MGDDGSGNHELSASLTERLLEPDSESESKERHDSTLSRSLPERLLEPDSESRPHGDGFRRSVSEGRGFRRRSGISSSAIRKSFKEWGAVTPGVSDHNLVAQMEVDHSNDDTAQVRQRPQEANHQLFSHILCSTFCETSI